MDIKGIVRRITFSKTGWFLAVLLLALALIMALPLVGCEQEENKEAAVSGNEYRQTKISFPESASAVSAMEKTNSGKIWVLEMAESEATQSLWELNDDNSWTEIVNLDEVLPLDSTDNVETLTISKNKEVFCAVTSYGSVSYSYKTRFYLIDPEFETYREFNTDWNAGFTYEVYALKNDQVLIQSSPTSLLLLDVTNETFKSIPIGEDKVWSAFLGVAELGDTVYVLYEDRAHGWRTTERTTTLCTLDVETGIFTDIKDEELTSLLDEYGAKETLRISPAMVAAPESVEKLTMLLRGGIIEYGSDGARVIVDARETNTADTAGTVICDSSKDILSCVFVNGNDFFVLTREFTNPDGYFFLYKYEKTGA